MMAVFMGLAQSEEAAVEKSDNEALSPLELELTSAVQQDVADTEDSESKRVTRQGRFFGRPYYGGGFYRPRPYYGGYGGFGRPYYGGGFYRPPPFYGGYGRPFYGGGFYRPRPYYGGFYG